MHATVTVKLDPWDSFRAHCQADARSFVSATVARATASGGDATQAALDALVVLCGAVMAEHAQFAAEVASSKRGWLARVFGK
jgi:hypothetical protein